MLSAWKSAAGMDTIVEHESSEHEGKQRNKELRMMMKIERALLGVWFFPI
jgi:hypothetical protein